MSYGPNFFVGGSLIDAFESGQKALSARNYPFAFKSYCAAAKHGNPAAMRMVGQFYHGIFGYHKDSSGQVFVRPDLAAARNLYERAAELGDSTACNLMRMLDDEQSRNQLNAPRP